MSGGIGTTTANSLRGLFGWTARNCVALFRRTAISLACLLLATSGYFLTYQLFFIEMPLEQLATHVSGDSSEKNFRYDHVVYFHGRVLQAGQRVDLDVGTPWITRYGDPSVEFFIELEELPEDITPDATVGRLQIIGLTSGEPLTHAVKGRRLQRFTVPWTKNLGKRNRISIRYTSSEAATPGADATTPPIAFATNVVGFSVWGYVILLAAAGVILLLFAPRTGERDFAWDRQRNSWRLVLLGFAVILFYLHSGAFTSHAMFPDHAKIGAACKNMATLVKEGHFKAVYYRQTGTILIPVLAALIEGNYLQISRSFCDIYPTTGYLIYLLWVAGLFYLMSVIRGIWGSGLAFLLGTVSALYFPFIIDLYQPDTDAYFIILFAFYLGAALNLLLERGSFRLNAGMILVVTFVMGLMKFTPVFLTLLLPTALLLKDWRAGSRRALLRCALGFAVLFTAFQSGKIVSNQYQHPSRNVGIEGQPFQRHVLWHMIWAGYGLYDNYSAHGFTKSGRLRNEKVAKRTGLPVTTYLRQSETATQKVYKPDILLALSERPGFFLATAMHRLYVSGLRFFRYNRGGPWRDLIDARSLPERIAGVKKTTKVIISNKLEHSRPNVNLIRYGEGWKTAPLMFLAKFTQFDITRLFDSLLLAAAIIGVFGFQSRPLRFFLIIIIAAQIGFSFAFHDVDRYFMFCSWALLLGLSLFLYNVVRAINGKPI